MRNDLSIKEGMLHNFMSEISERCWSAGWMHNLEYVLWDVLTNGERKYGQSFITGEDINTLKQLSEEANCWIVFDDQLEEIAIDVKAWQIKFSHDTNNKEE